MMIALLLVLLLSSYLALRLRLFFQGKQFGGRIRGKDRSRYVQSAHWDGHKFSNLQETTMQVNARTMPGLLRNQLKGRRSRSPKKPIPVLPIEIDHLVAGDERPRFIWFGHSVLLLQLGAKNYLIDPMFGPDASPIAPVSSRRFSEGTLSIIDCLPQIEAILLTHDHYDHLDYESIVKFRGKVDRYFVALGVGRHLERWGIPVSQITEFDWWDELIYQDIRFIFTPSRHFSGRGTADRAKSLWGGWILQTQQYRIYWSGDGGYGDHFKKIGKKYGPFDWAFVECGQYNHLWQQIHLFPEEAIQVARDVSAQVAIPVHWGGFTLALHHWTDPIERFVKEANLKDQRICCPRLGQLVIMGQTPTEHWWLDYK